MIPQQLANKKIAITGGTGFLGTALIERIFRCAPSANIVLLVRPGKRSTVEQRAKREIFRNNAFDRVKQELGAEEFEAQVKRRVEVIAGDVGVDGLGLNDEGRRILAECDTVIHSAATVSFEAPISLAVEVNLLGPTRIAETLTQLNNKAHLVAVSTCYVAGNRRGEANEQLLSATPFSIDVDWRAEVEAARRFKGDFDAESRTTEKLTEFRAQAVYELGAAGKPLLSAKTEQLRQRWVSEQLVEAGRARALSLGWPDAYAYSKALGEKALSETKGDIPTSIVRPSIIESAWSEPTPGWIKGFRMAEPLIISYARGVLTEFPGAPEGIIDVIPVDLVVAAIIAVAAKGHTGDNEIDITQVASGSTNPLRYHQLIEYVSEWFTENPTYDENGEAIEVAPWSYTGRVKLERQLERAQKGLKRADRALKLLPLRGRQALMTAGISQKLDEIDQAAGYIKIYGAYAECEALYGIDNLLKLHDSLTPEDQQTMGCDPRVVDWKRYVTEIHLPSIIQHARIKTTPEVSDPEARVRKLRSRVLSEDRQLAAFDLEGTIIASNVVMEYTWLATRNLGVTDRLKLAAKTIAEGPTLLAMDRKDRADFLRYFYRRYEGASVEEMEQLGPELLEQHLLKKAFVEALERVKEHKRLGHHTLLITGSLDIVVNPLRPLFDDVICSEMTVKDGYYTGELKSVPPTGEVRAQALRDYAAANGFNLNESIAYADSSSDLPLLDAVGFPVAVNPEQRLAAVASNRGWLMEYWRKPDGSALRLPMSELKTTRRSSK